MSRPVLRLAAAALLAALLAGCGALPDKPVQATEYDLGPLPLAEAPATPAGTALVLPTVEVGGSLESRAILYRLLYEDPQQLRPYAYARWSARPGALLRQRLQAHLGRRWPVLERAGASDLARRGGAAPPVLQLELEEFSHQFDAPRESRGVVQVRATLLQPAVGGERIVAQRTFSVARAAPTPDAPGGVRALGAATDALAADLAAWLQQVR